MLQIAVPDRFDDDDVSDGGGENHQEMNDSISWVKKTTLVLV